MNPEKTKIEQVAPIDHCWAIDHNFAKHAEYVLGTIDARTLEGPERNELYTVRDGVAIVSVDGPLTKKHTSVSALFGGCSTIQTRQALRKAAQDSAVRSVMLVFDSPGGQVTGSTELCDDVRAVAQVKPVVSYIEGFCASAAYWIASQAPKVVASRGSRIGSIGTYIVIDDESERLEREGIKVHLVTSGSVKGAGASGTKVTAEHLAHFQRVIDECAAQFVADVARGRGLSMEDATALATGEHWSAEDAKKLGLIDQVATIDDALESLRSGTAVPAAHGATMETQTPIQSGGITPVPLNPETPVSTTPNAPPPAPSVTIDAEVQRQLSAYQSQLEEMAASFGATAAEKRAQAALSAGKATSADVQALETLYLEAFKADGGGKVALGPDKKSVLAGPVTAALDAYIDAVPDRGLTAQVIVTDGTRPIVKPATGEQAMSDLRRTYFAATPVSRPLAAQERN